MNRLHEYLSRDHARLDELLAAAMRGDLDAYEEFRGGLLRHIGIEEKLLFPLLRFARGSQPLEEQLHRDHAVIAALLVPPPTSAELEQIASIIGIHNGLEEAHDGLYAAVEALTGERLDELMDAVVAYPPVKLAPHTDGETLRRSIAGLTLEADEGRRRLLASRSTQE